MITFLKFIVTLNLLMFLIFSMHAQHEKPTSKSEEQLDKLNTIEIDLYSQSFMRGDGFINNGYLWDRKMFKLRGGLTYKRKVDKYNSISASLSYLHTTDLSGPDRELWDAGEFLKRTMLLIEANHLHSLFHKKSVKLQLSSGLDFRYGKEVYHTTKDQADRYRLKDFGLSVGFGAEIELFWDTYFSSKVEYTRFLYTYAKNQPKIKIDPGPTKNMLSLQIGLGYRF